MNEIGQLVQGRYELLELAGRGGMGRVYRAATRGAAGFRRMVALKRLGEELTSSPEFVRMFIEEARVCSELDHPHVVQVHDFGVDARGHYLVMEWVDGVHLGQYMDVQARAGRALPFARVIEIGVQVLSGLAAAHEHLDGDGWPTPIIHRDLTPQNILLGVHGVAKLTDFGLARAMDRASITAPDVVKGKLSYLAPELVLGERASVQSDLYSLGIVLWEALAGTRLFWADSTSERLRKAREASIPRLESRRTDLPPALVAVVHRALARDPGLRFESADAMRQALLLSLGGPQPSPHELARAVVETRVSLGLKPRTERPPGPKSLPPPSALVAKRMSG